MEHRWGDRIIVDLPVSISGASVAGRGVLRNVSSTGGYVETALPLAALTMVRVQIPRGNSEWAAADVWGLVVRQDRGGVGIEWCDAAPVQASPPVQVSETRSFAVAS
jgi:hypothetical protein